MENVIVEKVLHRDGYVFVVVFNYLGWRCGYVGIPKGKKYYGVGMDKIPVSCHGGITYAKNSLLSMTEEAWWIGFSCDSHKDGIDFRALEEYYGKDSVEHAVLFTAHPIQTEWTCDRVYDEIQSIYNQIK